MRARFPTLGAVRATLGAIPTGDAGTRTTLIRMRQLARAGRWHPRVRTLAMQIVRGLGGRDGVMQAAALRDWLERNVEFLRDPDGIEALHTPEAMLRLLLTYGPPLAIDCDDAAILAAALAGSIGLRSRFVAVGFLSPAAPFRHVWAEVAPPSSSQWMEMDVTRAAQALPIQRVSRVLVMPV